MAYAVVSATTPAPSPLDCHVATLLAVTEEVTEAEPEPAAATAPKPKPKPVIASKAKQAIHRARRGLRHNASTAPLDCHVATLLAVTEEVTEAEPEPAAATAPKPKPKPVIASKAKQSIAYAAVAAATPARPPLDCHVATLLAVTEEVTEAEPEPAATTAPKLKPKPVIASKAKQSMGCPAVPSVPQV